MELKTKTLVGSRAGPRLLITGGVHGDEFEPIAAIHRLTKEVDPAELRGRLTVIPIVNEPAFLRGARTADDGLDLARVCPGRADGSVTERIAHALSPLIRSTDLYIDLHTGGTNLCVLPFTGYKMHTDPAVLDQQRKMARAFNLPIVWGTHPGLDGRTLSVARDAGVPAIYAEYMGAARCDPQGVEAYTSGCLNVMGAVGMIDRPKSPPAVVRVIEDSRPNSGHMQICNRSPMTGFFQAAVQLGDSVESGDLLGTVSDPLGATSADVRTDQSGIVLVLHTYCRVLEGDGLAVILETD